MLQMGLGIGTSIENANRKANRALKAEARLESALPTFDSKRSRQFGALLERRGAKSDPLDLMDAVFDKMDPDEAIELKEHLEANNDDDDDEEVQQITLANIVEAVHKMASTSLHEELIAENNVMQDMRRRGDGTDEITNLKKWIRAVTAQIKLIRLIEAEMQGKIMDDISDSALVAQILATALSRKMTERWVGNKQPKTLEKFERTTRSIERALKEKAEPAEELRQIAAKMEATMRQIKEEKNSLNVLQASTRGSINAMMQTFQEQKENHHANHDKSGNSNRNANNDNHQQRSLDHITCFRCHQTGHYASSCPTTNNATNQDRRTQGGGRRNGGDHNRAGARQICRNFQRSGTCPYGRRCKFVHEPSRESNRPRERSHSPRRDERERGRARSPRRDRQQDRRTSNRGGSGRRQYK